MIEIDALLGLIEAENARNMSQDGLVQTFVWTPSFSRLLSPTNHIVVGSRGSGKTALAKMLSHDHLAGLAGRGYDEASRLIRDRTLIGIYVSTKAEWVGTMKNKPWKNDAEKEAFFSWRLNIASCHALLRTIRSCLECYVPDELNRLRAEYELVQHLSTAWFPGEVPAPSLIALRERLEDTEYRRNLQITEARVGGHFATDEQFVGIAFAGELFSPLKRGIRLLSRIVDFPERAKWILCIDEAEFLDEDHHRILNSHMRSDSQDLTFKITTTPYHHLTLATNTGAPLRVRQDFEYVYIDQERGDLEQEEFADQLFQNMLTRRGVAAPSLNLRTLLGSSTLLESKSSLWKLQSPEMAMLKEYATPSLWNRAQRLYEVDQERFRNEVVRKVHGLLKLRAAVHNDRGNRNFTLYSGAKMLVRCGDNNPRRLLQMIGLMIRAVDRSRTRPRAPLVTPQQQSLRMIQFSQDMLGRTKSEPGCGEDLYDLINTLGEHLRRVFHDRPFSGDVPSGIEFDETIPPRQWELVQSAVEIGLLYPAIGRNNPDSLPIRAGRFHLANVLAPWFKLLPRRGKPVRLSTIISNTPRRNSRQPDQDSLWDGERG